MNFQPRNAVEAARLARTAERAARLVSEGYCFDESGDSVLVSKPGRLAFSYQIDIRSGKCDCPDFVNHGNYCKHTLAWEEIKEDAAMWESICAEEEARAEREF